MSEGRDADLIFAMQEELLRLNAEIPPLRALLRQVVPLVTDRMEKRRAEGCEIDAEYWETWLATASLFLASPKTPATPTPGDEDRGT